MSTMETISVNELNYDFSYVILEQLLDKKYITEIQFKLALNKIKELYKTT